VSIIRRVGDRSKAVAKRGATAVAVPSENLPTGYHPEELDQTIQKFIAVAEVNIRHAQRLSKRVEDALAALDDGKAEDPVEHANKMTIIWERLAKTGMALVKSTDELTRLRSFVAGGPDSRPDLTVKGELQLRTIVLAAVKQLGKEAVMEVFADDGV